MSGFVSHLHVIKSKLLVIEEPVKRGGFSPICYFMLGCERSQDHVSPGNCLAGILDVGRLGKVHKGEEEHPECGSVALMKPLVPSIVLLGREIYCHKLHPGPGSQAIQIYPKQVFSH